MDTVRSEYSDSSSALGSSRLGGAVSFADSSSFASSRASTNRSDLVSSLEQKLLARRAHKKKKREREIRRQVATANQLTADEQRRADRDAERKQRHAEMAQWLPTREALRRRAADRHLRGHQALQAVLTWYPPSSDGVAPLFSRDAQQHAQLAAAEHALAAQATTDAAALHRRVAELQQKLQCVDRLRQQQQPATRQHRPPKRRHHSVAPLAVSFFRDAPADAADALEMDAFLSVHKRQRRRQRAATRLQATWRMRRCRRRFLAWRRGERWRRVAACFSLWALAFKLARHARRALVRRHLRAWRSHVAGALTLRRLELRLFRAAEPLAELPRLVANLVLTADGEDDDAFTRKVLAHPTKPSYVNAAFLAVDEDSATLAPRRLQQQHLALRRALAKKVVQRAFKLWHAAHAAQRRTQLNAALCLKRAVRLAMDAPQRPAWRGEKLLLVFEVWARWASFHRARRLRVPPPAIFQPLPHWDLWLHNYQERMVRRVKAAARAPLATMRRCFRRFRCLAIMARRKREASALAASHFAARCRGSVLHAWRAAIAQAAAVKKLLRGVLLAWRGYAQRKRLLRPRRRKVEAMRRRREHARAWAAWRHVQLRCRFRRELHRARLAGQPRWRWQVRRLLCAWLAQRPPLVLARAFAAWRRRTQRRALWLTALFHCRALRRRHLAASVLAAWKAVVWKQEDEFLEDRLRLSAWDVRCELAPLLPMLFYGADADAAALFGGVPSNDDNKEEEEEEKEEDAVARRQRAVREFHAAIAQGSVAEARNAIVRGRHLLNAADEASGNTALHVAAAQLPERVRRREVTALLLSEGACSQRRANRHGLRPAQLVDADDSETAELLRGGVYPFFKRRALAERGEQPDAGAVRLVWALLALLSSELVTGLRIPAGEIDQREWHSELQEERWLRRGRVAFDCASPFAPAVARCQALVHGIQRRLWRPVRDALAGEWQQRQRQQPQVARSPPRLRRGTRRMPEEGKVDLLSWLRVRPEDSETGGGTAELLEAEADDGGDAMGEDSAYAALLQSPSGGDAAAERWLVRSFVGVVFSLGVPLATVWREAQRLEALCDALEDDVLRTYQAIMRAELWAPPLLRFFSETGDTELFFQRERLQAVAALRRSKAAAVSDVEDETLRIEAAAVLARTQRKQRKVERKVEAARQQAASLEAQLTRLLLLERRGERLREDLAPLVDARLQLETVRLRVAKLRLKQQAWAEESRSLTELLQELDMDKEEAKEEEEEGTTGEEWAAKREFLEAQMAAHVEAMRSETASGVSKSEPARTTLRQLHRSATAALCSLIVANLLRRCCWFLVENLVKEAEIDDDAVEGEEVADAVGGDAASVADAGAEAGGGLSDLVSSAVATSFAAARKASVLAAASPVRRRSSLVNARTAVETLQRSAASTADVERLTAMMRETYTGSAQLLFMRDREELASEEARRRRRVDEELRRQRRQDGSAADGEHNPITGQPETAASRLLDAGEVEAVEQRVAAAASGGAEEQRRSKSRKRELLRYALAQRQLARLTRRAVAGVGGEEETEEEREIAVAESEADAVVCGEDGVGFGNFVVGGGVAEPRQKAVQGGAAATLEDALATIAAESLWKRGGGVRRPGESGKASVDLFASAEDELAFNASFRVMSASKERRSGGTRRLSAIGVAVGRSDVGEEEGEALSPPKEEEVEEREELIASVADTLGGVVQEESSLEVGADGPGSESPVMDPGEEEVQRQGTEDSAPPTVAVDLTTEISATEETEFFDRTLQQYLDRVRRDSFVGSTALPSDAVVNGAMDAAAVDTTVDTSSHSDQNSAVVEPPVAIDCASTKLKTPHVKWEPSLTEENNVHPLVVDTIRSRGVVVSHEPRRRATTSTLPIQVCEPQEEAISKPTELLLSGKAVALQDGRRRSSVRLLHQLPASSSLATSPGDDEPTPLRDHNCSESLAAIDEELPLERIASPKVPKVVIAIQRKAVEQDNPPPTQEASDAPTEDPPPALPLPSPSRKTSTQRPLALAVCELAVIPSEGSGGPVTETPSRRRPSQQDRPGGATDLKKKLASRRATIAAAPVELSLAGVRAVPLATAQDDPHNGTTLDLEALLAAPELSLAQKKGMWHEFTTIPLTEVMQDAYAQVYPHLYEAVTPAPAVSTAVAPSASTIVTTSSPASQVPLDKQLVIDKRFWSAVEGYKAVGSDGGLVPLDSKALKTRRQDQAVAIYQQFLCPNAPTRVCWIDMYEKELRVVQQRLLQAPRSLFDALQQSAQLHISMVLSGMQANQIQ